MRITAALFVTLTTLSISAQVGRTELRTDSGLVVLHFFTNGLVSTKEWTDKDDRWGRSFAYDPDGREIFSYHTRRVGGHASAHFSYHPNGGVRKIEVSDAPDAGIQWYRSTATYDEAGNRIGFMEQRHEDIISPHTTLETPPPSVAICQRMFMNEVYLVNATRQAGKARVKALHPSPALRDSEHTLAPGDTVRLGMYSMGETFNAPDKHLSVEVRRALRNRKKPVALGVLRTDPVQVNAEHRRYYLVVRSWGK
jgi:hypothetical protein